MELILQLLFGWPGILLFLILATMAVWNTNQKMMMIALIFSIGPALYLLTGNGWVQLVGVYIPLSLGGSALLIKSQRLLIAKLLLLPLYGFYTWFAYMIVTQ